MEFGLATGAALLASLRSLLAFLVHHSFVPNPPRPPIPIPIARDAMEFVPLPAIPLAQVVFGRIFAACILDLVGLLFIRPFRGLGLKGFFFDSYVC